MPSINDNADEEHEDAEQSDEGTNLASATGVAAQRVHDGILSDVYSCEIGIGHPPLAAVRIHSIRSRQRARSAARQTRPRA